ncbi:Membrane protein involved in the export of O-antigen and teichoic acid [Actinokineospora alba]|uniref:Membrane protein involved in the export of O-antigen and teichoic acid n=1 Tax=Actinokineospora alba TaxID=504798 RepID=A0A1H0S6N0_9PSEU|nr:polysaccharide biosynthesis protein [Actinokineospora alba]TDP66745.1 O-antigen/teichoic acid export membrane protein [Actinokineospora alba]SDI50545.1 Membrane protein involved in the export of O-antigen and teichoic acid [Actinokineospora alba]SDP37305.1 Membrane protein involved in the export of O-antigen and teichoic acid [Actinokineospora alba]
MTVNGSSEATPALGRGRFDAVLVAGALGVNNVASYLLTLVAARLLVPAAFGELGSLLAVLVIGAVPALGLQTVVALRVAGDTSPGPPGPLTALGFGTSVSIMVVALLSTPLFVWLLHLDGPGAMLFLALALGPITLNGLWYGTLQGAQRFGTMSRLVVTEGAGRIGGTLVGLMITRTPTGALAGAAAGAVVVAFVGWLICGKPRPTRLDIAHVRDVLHAAQALLALVLLVNLDLVLARHTLPEDVAGAYAVGAVLTKIAYWLPYAIAIVVLPKLASDEGRRRVIPLALGLCAVLNVIVVGGSALFGELGVRLIGGAKYASSVVPLWEFALVGSLLSLVQILLFSRIASADRRSTVLTWVAVLVEIGLVLVWLNGSLTNVVTAAVIATGALAVAGAVVELRSRRVPVAVA